MLRSLAPLTSDSSQCERLSRRSSCQAFRKIIKAVRQMGAHARVEVAGARRAWPEVERDFHAHFAFADIKSHPVRAQLCSDGDGVTHFVVLK